VAGDRTAEPAGTGPEERRGEEWLKRLADALDDQPITSTEFGKVLKLAREVAHGVERKLAPLAAFLAGVHVGRRAAEGGSREEALAEAVAAAGALLAEPSDEAKGSAPSGGE
jgi:hypothetical protein